MESFSKNIDGICNLMKDMKAEKYAIVNPELVDMDAYVKELYIKILCTVILYKNEPTDMQILFLKRIVKGMKVDNSMEEYMRKALEISDVDMQEFLTIFAEQKIKYYFTLDGIILLAIGNGSGEKYQYFAEIIELLGVNKEDLEYICTVAKSILQQDSSYYNQSKNMINERVETLDFAPYIQNYYSGAIVNSKLLVHYISPNRKKDIVYKTNYTEQKIIFENVDMTILSEWKFTGCEEIIFENCNITGDAFSMNFMSCKKIWLKECSVKNFKTSVIVEQEIGEVIIENCIFENCYKEYSESLDNWKSRTSRDHQIGGIIYSADHWMIRDNKKTKIKKSIFKNCGGKNKRSGAAEGIIANCGCEVIECKFMNCKNYTNDAKTVDNEGTLFLSGTKNEGNEVIGSARFCNV